MAAKVASGNNKVFQNHDDVHISFEDQQKINRFAKHNARMDDLKVELDMKKNDLKSVEEALDEIELFDEEEDIPFLIGEVFLSHKLSRTQELLQEAKEQTLKEIASIEAKANDIKSEMNELKAQLYQRFGSNISLESDD
ncbi:putative prefoldin subunit 4 [Lucilia cuprina]|uniref:Prefoldin subunit 4 n=1 Tax=Lucilia cuprina TaxID=7375 RepID=A0A0L0CCD3_LUCCU|nr:probable prefoldin subunit 4 [Lucilia cuprina]XP_037815583.1 probable prefoldin subunit 4 [Lucilia sericata]KAI8126272.1 putative prefoldin subunit 4 [Lucilia cuprina]KNC29891.1 putative prefoldin subunit 4 [Lucilia cuprina]